MAAAAALALAMLATSTPAQAGATSDGSRPTSINTVRYQVVNAPSPVAFRTHPNWNYPTIETFVTYDKMDLTCYFFGGAAGPHNNTLWYLATSVQSGFQGLINDHHLNTPGTAANPQPQTGPCDPAGWGDDFMYWETFTAVNAPGTVLWGNSPSKTWPAGHGFTNNDRIALSCHLFGAPAGPYNNTLWYMAYNHDRDSHGWINDHNLNTPGTAANPQPQTQKCGRHFW